MKEGNKKMNIYFLFMSKWKILKRNWHKEEVRGTISFRNKEVCMKFKGNGQEIHVEFFFLARLLCQF